tara:strand:- start:33 stop:212 length:180 start_codon:yes stop_codon:yes gene_type:complete
MPDLDRKYIAQCLAKAEAYAQVGKEEQAEAWARELVRQLGLAGILKGEEAWEYLNSGSR